MKIKYILLKFDLGLKIKK